MTSPPTVEEIDAAFAVIRRALLAGRETAADRMIAERDGSLERLGLSLRPFVDACRAREIEGAVRGTTGWRAPEAAVVAWMQRRQDKHKAAHAHRRGRRDLKPSNDSTPAQAGPSNEELLAGAGLVPARAAGGRR